MHYQADESHIPTRVVIAKAQADLQHEAWRAKYIARGERIRKQNRELGDERTITAGEIIRNRWTGPYITSRNMRHWISYLVARGDILCFYKGKQPKITPGKRDIDANTFEWPTDGDEPYITDRVIDDAEIFLADLEAFEATRPLFLMEAGPGPYG